MPLTVLYSGSNGSAKKQSTIERSLFTHVKVSALIPTIDGTHEKVSGMTPSHTHVKVSTCKLTPSYTLVKVSGMTTCINIGREG